MPQLLLDPRLLVGSVLCVTTILTSRFARRKNPR
jgi:hypothetical protein